MKFKIDSEQVRNDRRKKWHAWFAWYPVRLNESEVAWLEFVQRKGFLVDRPQETPYWKWYYKGAENERTN